MESITLQTSDSVVASGDILGRLSFAASNEASAGDSLLIGGMIRAEAEGEFTSTANPTSIIFSTGASETAQDKLKITSVGDVIPVNHNQNDLGSSSSKFKNVYVGNQVNVASGIVFTSGVPSTTINTIYYHNGLIFISSLPTLCYSVESNASSSITLTTNDIGKYIRTTSASGVTITVPSGLNVATGAEFMFEQAGAGQITISPASGVTINTSSSLTSSAQYAVLGIKSVASNVYTAFGDRT